MRSEGPALYSACGSSVALRSCRSGSVVADAQAFRALGRRGRDHPALPVEDARGFVALLVCVGLVQQDRRDHAETVRN